MTVLGIDAGLYGALAQFDPASKMIVSMDDIPTFDMTINRKTRKRVDAVALLSLLEMYKMCGCEMAIIESVGGRPQQGASAGYVLGYVVGLIYMACITVKIPIDTVPPRVWKKTMGVPGKRQKDMKAGEINHAIISRADELMPDARELWRGIRGGYKVDRAEAAMLAKYGAEYRLRLERVPLAVSGMELLAAEK